MKKSTIFYGLAFLGILLAIGSAGALEQDAIGIGQFIIQALIGAGIAGLGVWLGNEISGE